MQMWFILEYWAKLLLFKSSAQISFVPLTFFKLIAMDSFTESLKTKWSICTNNLKK